MAYAVDTGMCRTTRASSQIEAAYPPMTIADHSGSLKPWVRGSAAVAATSVAMAASSRPMAAYMFSSSSYV